MQTPRLVLAVLAAATAGAPAAGATGALVYSFMGKRGLLTQDGATPVGRLLALNGTLYGITERGGTHRDGTVFAIAPDGTESVLYSFKGHRDGASPYAGLIAVNGTLYGTARFAGAHGFGTVFSLTPAGVFRTLYAFRGGDDGAIPAAELLPVGRALFGTTQEGGGGTACPRGCGTVFKLTLGGRETVRYRFTGGADGAFPIAPLVAIGGTLYGTTSQGGGAAACVDGCGTVFTMPLAGTATVLHAFAGGSADGAAPVGGLAKLRARLYGTTAAGGVANRGTVFAIDTAGAEAVLYSFTGGQDGAGPHAGLLVAGDTLYGTTYDGGVSCMTVGCGTVFAITRTGIETTLYRFHAGLGDGRNPWGGVTALNGALYGVTMGGGAHSSGTVFTVQP